MVVVGASLAGPIDDQADKLLWVHMIQHLMLADVASLLIVFGFTGPLLQPLLKFRAGRPLRVLTHPVVAITAFTLNLYIWHIPFLYQAVLTDTPLHVLEHLLFPAPGSCSGCRSSGRCRNRRGSARARTSSTRWGSGRRR